MREHYWRQAEILQRRSDLVYEMMPILYALVKSTKGDIDLAYENINEGKEMKRDKHGNLVFKSDFCPIPCRPPRDRSPSNHDDDRNIEIPKSPDSKVDLDKEEDSKSDKSLESPESNQRISPVNPKEHSDSERIKSYQLELLRMRRIPIERLDYYPRTDFTRVPNLIECPIPPKTSERPFVSHPLNGYEKFPEALSLHPNFFQEQQLFNFYYNPQVVADYVRLLSNHSHSFTK